MALNDVYQVTLVTVLNGQRAINTLHFKETSECSDDLPARSVCAMYEEELLPLWQLMMSNEAALSCIYARRIKPTLHIPFQVVESSSPGLVDSHSAPANAAAILTLYTTEVGRSGRGRQFLSGIPESRISGGIMESTQITAINNYADQLKLQLSAPAPYTGKWDCGIYSPLTNTFNQLYEYVVNPSMGTLESRRQPFGMTG